MSSETASDGKSYLRRGAQSLPQLTEEQITRLKYNKGLSSYEDQLVNIRKSDVTNALPILEFMTETVPTAEPEPWLKKQQLIVDDRPTVAAVVLYAEEPQAILPKAGVKLYRYRTSGEPTRDTLAQDPRTLEGHAYALIFESIQSTVNMIQEIPVVGTSGLERVIYPRESIHEIITNAVLHRDYSVNDEIHIRVFDNRIEVQSPGTLAGHVTVSNIVTAHPVPARVL